MTPQQLKAMKLALEALKLLTDTEQTFGALDYGDNAITAIKEVLAEHAMREVQSLGQEIEQEPLAITNEMAFAFHGALTDGAVGEGEVEEIKAGLAAAFAHITTPPQRKPLNWEPIQEFWRNNSNIDWDELESAIKQAAHDLKENT